MAHNEIVGCPKFSFFSWNAQLIVEGKIYVRECKCLLQIVFYWFAVYYIALICCLAGSFIKLLSHFIYRTARDARLLCCAEQTIRVASANSSQIIKLILIAPQVPLRDTRKSNLEPVLMELSIIHSILI